MMSQVQSISMNIEAAALQLEALGNATRLSIYRTLVRAGENGLPVGKLQLKLDVPSSTLSHHIKKLAEVGLLTQERQATTLICRANYEAMNGLIGYLADECCADAGGCATEDAEAAA
jgi:DNA-binding transcriptional ArsR family regulator